MEQLIGPALAGLAILAGGLVKGATGMGAPLIAVPVMASIYNVPTAIAVMTVPLVVSNLWQIWQYRGAREGREALWWLLAGCLPGVVAGTFLLGLLDEAWLSLMLAALVLVYLALRWLKADFVIPPARARNLSLPVGLFTGILQGAAGMTSAIGVTFIHAQRLPRQAYVFAVSVMFTALSATQLLSLSAIGLMSWHLAFLSAAALIPIMLGVWLGQKLSDRVSQRTFDRLTEAVLLLVAIGLIVSGVSELLRA